MRRTDVTVVGGGILGLATADALLSAEPGLDVLVLEKEPRLASHQTGRNSGVLHSGLYYRPSSLKARLCVAGRRSLLELCHQEGVAHEVCGKVVVAVDVEELPALRVLHERAAANGVRAELVDAGRLRELEPHAAGVAALHVLDTGIVDFRAVTEALCARVRRAGGEVRTGCAVLAARAEASSMLVEASDEAVRSSFLVNCAGLQADRVAAAGGAAPDDLRIVPFRGEYYELVRHRRQLVRNLVYPVPDPRFPFLGVHLTRGIDGGVHAGPNAVLATAREGYRWRDVEPAELRELVAFPGMRRLARAHWRTGAHEVLRSLMKRRFVADLQRLVPDLVVSDLEEAPAGVRAQAVRVDGSLVDDFAFRDAPRALHVLNAPSPAATASLEIGKVIAARVLAARAA